MIRAPESRACPLWHSLSHQDIVQVLTAACRHRQLTVTCCDQVLLDTSTSTGPQYKSDHYIFCICGGLTLTLCKLEQCWLHNGRLEAIKASQMRRLLVMKAQLKAKRRPANTGSHAEHCSPNGRCFHLQIGPCASWQTLGVTRGQGH